MQVGVGDHIDVNARGEHLGAEIQAGVDDHAEVVRPSSASSTIAAVGAAVLRIGRIAVAPVAGDTRDTGRQAAAEHREPQRVRGSGVPAGDA